MRIKGLRVTSFSELGMIGDYNTEIIIRDSYSGQRKYFDDFIIREVEE